MFDLVDEIKSRYTCRDAFREFWPHKYNDVGYSVCPHCGKEKFEFKANGVCGCYHVPCTFNDAFPIDSIKLYAMAGIISNSEAVNELAERFNLRAPQSLQEQTPQAKYDYLKHRNMPTEEALDYLVARGFTEDFLDQCYEDGLLAFSERTNRWCFPLYDASQTEILALQHIAIDGQKRFEGPTGDAFYFCGNHQSNTVVVTEAVIDALSVAQVTDYFVVSILGAGMTRKLADLNLLEGKKVVLFLDNYFIDNAGKDGTRKAFKTLKGKGLKSVIANWIYAFNVKDANDLLRKGEADLIQKLIETADEDVKSPFYNYWIDDHGELKSKRKEHRKITEFLLPFLPKLRFDSVSSDWYVYEDNRWQKADKLYAHQMIDKLITEFDDSFDFTEPFFNGVVGLIKNQVAKPGWNQLEDALPFQNGVLLWQTGEFVKHKPEHDFTWQLPYEYNADATCETVIEWLTELVNGNEDIVNVIRGFAKCVITGKAAEFQRYIELVGPGGTGKSTVRKLIEECVGYENIHSTSLKQLEEGKHETAAIYGKRLVVVPDAEKYSGDVMNLKILTSGMDPVRYEEKFKPASSFVYKGAFIICANGDITFKDSSSGLQRRRLTVNFTHRIESQDEKFFDNVLRPHIPGLINWCLSMPDEDVRKYVKETDKHVDAVREATVEQRIATHPLGGWVHDCLVVVPEHEIQIGNKNDMEGLRLYPSYIKWCDEGNSKSPVSLKNFPKVLEELLTCQLGLDVARKKENNKSVFIGIRIRKDTDEDQLLSPFDVFAKGNGNVIPSPSEPSFENGQERSKGLIRDRMRRSSIRRHLN